MPDYEIRRLAARWIGWTPVRIWGMVPVERLRRSLARAGVWDAGPWTGQAPAEPGTLLLLLGDHVYDDAVIDSLAHSPNVALVRGDGRIVAVNVARHRADHIARALVAGEDPATDLPRRKGSDMVPPAILHLRRHPAPLVMPVSAELHGAVEDRLFTAACPAITDAIAKYLWPVPARLATRACISLGLSANALRLIGLGLALLAGLLFHGGWFWPGLACAWAVSLLNFVTTALARVTLNSAQLGGALDQFLNLVPPPLWWGAWWLGCGGSDDGALVVMVAGAVTLQAEEMLFRWRFALELPLWRRFDSLFQLIIAQRNGVLTILTTGLVLGRPFLGFQVAAAWMLVCITVYAIRILQAARLTMRGIVVKSWL